MKPSIARLAPRPSRAGLHFSKLPNMSTEAVISHKNMPKVAAAVLCAQGNLLDSAGAYVGRQLGLDEVGQERIYLNGGRSDA